MSVPTQHPEPQHPEAQHPEAQHPEAQHLEYLSVVPWSDPLFDERGFEPRSAYVERFWLPLLGPSTTLLLRRVARGLQERPDGFRLRVPDTARAMGIGNGTGRNSPFVRSVDRACHFGLARHLGPGEVAVRTKVPPLNLRQVERLPLALRSAHGAWLQRSSDPNSTERAETLARCLIELGSDLTDVEQRLSDWGTHPALAHHVAVTCWGQAHLH